MKLKDIIGAVGSILPGGGIVKSIIKGAGSLLIKKAVRKVGVSEQTIGNLFTEMEKIAENDPEVQKALAEENQKQREFELAFYGKAAELSPKAQVWRTLTRPIISFGLVGLFVIGILVQYVQQIFGSEVVLAIPNQLVVLVKWVCAFWFSGRSIEKVVGLFNGKKK